MKESTKKNMKENTKQTKEENIRKSMTQNREQDTDANAGKDKTLFKINFHLVFAVVAIFAVIIMISKFWGFGRGITKEEIDAIPAPDNPEITVYDTFFRVEDTAGFPADDGVTTIVCFGNAPFADDRDSSGNPCRLLAEETGAVVYNCSIPNSYMSTYSETFSTDYSMDAFSFYHLAAAAAGDSSVLDEAVDAMGELDGDTGAAVTLLQDIDFNTVDFIYIMYDASDHFARRAICNVDNMSDPRFFAGSMISGIQLIRQAYPWIQVIVMSPAYAYDLAEDGSYIGSDSKELGSARLSTYFFYQYDACTTAEVNFVDILYGGISEDNAADYLSDNVHLNEAGRRLIADRMKEALAHLL